MELRLWYLVTQKPDRNCHYPVPFFGSNYDFEHFDLTFKPQQTVSDFIFGVGEWGCYESFLIQRMEIIRVGPHLLDQNIKVSAFWSIGRLQNWYGDAFKKRISAIYFRNMESVLN